ncbi:hypothetical protein BD324DRAFT_628268 [Kockovaella imperatae]|uniref:Uncharacterized protein n=1 Tax=Kockovaella imperatae TaxID=4999 RepID=A0A1Y1UFM4_9TREE|nr:hypothetical protein BD324DRAFT_628268 [Kockovaella imperatae]ORX36314.1 hypothetical protein BD324DRAFT_628268 [Kockovaella imperatae]
MMGDKSITALRAFCRGPSRMTTRVLSARTVPAGPRRTAVIEPMARFNSTLSGPPPDAGRKSRIKVHPIFWVAIGTILLYPTYMIVDYLASARTYPPAVRKPLREAVRHRYYGEIEEAEENFQKALEISLGLPASDFGPDALIKLSGLFAEYAKLLETSGQSFRAYRKLIEALDLFGPHALSANPLERISGEWSGCQPLSQEDHLRVIALHQKLGQLALQLATSARVYPYPRDLSATVQSGPTSFMDAAEYHLSSAVTALLRIGLATAPQSAEKSKNEEPVVVGRDLQLPSGSSSQLEGLIDRQGLGITMEALAEVYARKGQFEYAQQLLLQAISTLLPPNETKPLPRDRCQAAMLMTSISGHSHQSTSKDARKISRSWAVRAIELTNGAMEDAKGALDEESAKQICGRAASVALFNLGMMAELDSDIPKALDRFSKSLARAREIKFTQGEIQSSEAIKRIRYSKDGKWSGS